MTEEEREKHAERFKAEIRAHLLNAERAMSSEMAKFAEHYRKQQRAIAMALMFLAGACIVFCTLAGITAPQTWQKAIQTGCILVNVWSFRCNYRTWVKYKPTR